VSLRLGPSLEGGLAAVADGRVLVIDAVRSRSCCAWVGDLTVRWARSAPGDGFATPALVGGVPVVVRSSLVGLLREAGASLHRARSIRRDAIRVELDRSELWIDWLEHPGRWSADLAEPEAPAGCPFEVSPASVRPPRRP
jgi:hypothetical protein